MVKVMKHTNMREELLLENDYQEEEQHFKNASSRQP